MHVLHSIEPDDEKVVDFIHSHIELRGDGIIQINSAENFVFEVEHIKENHSAVKKIVGNGKALLLNIAGVHASVTKEAREYVATAPHKTFVAAEAFVIQSMAQKLVANFFLRVNKPIVPVRFFKTANEAERWLRGFE